LTTPPALPGLRALAGLNPVSAVAEHASLEEGQGDIVTLQVRATAAEYEVHAHLADSDEADADAQPATFTAWWPAQAPTAPTGGASSGRIAQNHENITQICSPRLSPHLKVDISFQI
jgi:hypothetical protein